jgi:pyrroline-5-carboxylate reductase
MNVAIIGAGVIGSAIAKSLILSGYAGRVMATDKRPEQIDALNRLGVTATSDNKLAAEKADIIIMCVKPRDVENALKEIRNEIAGKIVISIAAAVSLGLLKKAAPEAKIVRAMPNLAILVQESFTVYCVDRSMSPEEKEHAEKVLKALGKAVEIDEQWMDAITALSGCAPAYLSIIMEAMVHAGSEAGLPADIALAASAQSMVGTGKLVLEAQKTPSAIKEMVTTPGGVTEEELKELAKAPIGQIITDAIKAGTAKSRKISQSLT